MLLEKRVSHRSVLQRLMKALGVLTAVVIVLFVVSLSIGVLSTFLLPEVDWQSAPTQGFPQSRPWGIHTLAVDPTDGTLFVATDPDNHVFRSDDNGLSWQAVTHGLIGREITSFAIGTNVVYAGTTNGLLYSNNEGQNWKSVSNELSDQAIYVLIVGADNVLYASTDSEIFQCEGPGSDCLTIGVGFGGPGATTLLEGADGTLFVATAGSGLFRSDNQEESWQPLDEGLASQYVNAVIEDTNGILFVGTQDGVFRSDDGVVWQSANKGLSNLDIQDIVQGSDGVLYVSSWENGVFRSQDRGRSWHAVNEGLYSLRVNNLEIGPSGTIYAGTPIGIFRFDDEKGWRSLSEGLSALDVFAIERGPDGVLYAGVWGGGVFRSSDGKTWQAANEGLPNLQPRTLAVGPDSALWVGTPDGAFWLNSRKGIWSAVKRLSEKYVYDFVLGVDGWFYAATEAGIFRSRDGREDWQAVNDGLGEVDRWWTLTQGPKNTLFAASLGGGYVFRFNDETTRWEMVTGRLSYGAIRALQRGPADALYAGTWGDGIYRSDDQGESWERVNNGLTSLLVNTLWQGSDGTLYAGADGGIFRLGDDGENWHPVDNGLVNRSVHALTEGSDDTFYSGTYGGGISRLESGTELWETTNKGLSSLSIHALAVRPDGTYFAGTEKGVFRSNDGGKRWQAAGEELAYSVISDLMLDSKNVLYAASDSRVFRTEDIGAHWPISGELNGLSIQDLIKGPDDQVLAVAGGYLFYFQGNETGWNRFTEFPSDFAVQKALFAPDNSLIVWGKKFGEQESAVYQLDGDTLQPLSLSGWPKGKVPDEIGNSENFVWARIKNLLWLSRDGRAWLPVMRSPHPSQLDVTEGRLRIRALAGAGMFQEASLSLPFVWRMPGPFDTLIAASRSLLLEIIPSLLLSVWGSISTWGQANQLVVKIIGGSAFIILLSIVARTRRAKSLFAALRESPIGRVLTRWLESLLRLERRFLPRTWKSSLVKGFLVMFALIVVLGIVGVAATARIPAAEWESESTIFVPPGPPRSVDDLTVDSSGTAYAVSEGRLFRRDVQDAAWQLSSTGITHYVNTVFVNKRDGFIYAGTKDGRIFRSVGGERWTAFGKGLPEHSVTVLAMGEDGVFYVGIENSGVFRSADGQRWEPVNEGLVSLSIRALVLGRDGVLYAGASNQSWTDSSGEWQTLEGGVFRLVDGERWEAINEGLTDLNVRTLVMGKGGMLYAGTSAGVFRSADGQRWEAVNEGLTDPSVGTLLVGEGGMLYAGTSAGVFRSADGQRWEAVNEGLTDPIVETLVMGEGGMLYAGTSDGVFRSADGQRWAAFNEGLISLSIQASVVGEGGVLYVVTENSGVFRLVDGERWEAVNEGLTNLDVGTLVVGEGGMLYAETYKEVFRSADGQRWEPVNEGLTDPIVETLVMGEGGMLYAGTSDGVFRSADGRRWEPVNEGLVSLSIRALVWDRGGVLYAGASTQRWGDSSGELHTLEGGVFRLVDGQRWEPVNEGLTNLSVWTLVVGEGGMLYAGTFDGVFRSADGEHWEAVNEGLTDASVGTLVVGEGGAVYASTSEGVFRLADGERWEAVNEGLTSLSIQTLVVAEGGMLYAGTSNGGVFRLVNGEGWEAVNEGVTDWDVRTLAIGEEGALYAKTTFYRYPSGSYGYYGPRSYRWVFRSEDGRYWEAVNEGLTDLDVQTLAVDEAGAVYASTSDGVFRLTDEECWEVAIEKLPSPYYINALAVDGDMLYVGTSDEVFCSVDGGKTWKEVNEGLTDFSATTLAINRDGEVYVHGTRRVDDKGDFRSLDEMYVLGLDDIWYPWSPQPGLPPDELPDAIGESADGDFLWARTDRQLWLSRDGRAWLPAVDLGWAQDLQSVSVQDGQLSLRSSCGAGMFLHSQALSLPFIWRLPDTYLTLVAAMWSLRSWVQANPMTIALLFVLLPAGLLVMLVVNVARPNKLRLATVLWLLPHPRHLLAASAYRGYVERWAAGEPLERLILLQAPADAPFTPAQLEAKLRQLDAAFDAEGLLAALSALIQRGLLVRENGTWRLAEPLLAQLQRREVFHDALALLAEQTRQEHPFYAEARRFLAQAGFAVRPTDPFGFLCTSELPLWADISPLYVQLVLERTLGLEEFQSLCAAAEVAYGEAVRGHTAAVVIDRPPRAGDLYQIFAIRAQQGLTVVPLPRSLLIQARLDEREMEALREQVELYTGRADLYDIRAAVTDVLSFFGRGGLLAELERRLTYGRSAVVFGVRKIGKSSLLGRLREECPWLVAIVDLQGYVGGLEYIYEESLRGWRAALQTAFPDLVLPEWTGDLSALDPVAKAQAFRRTVGDLLDLLAARPGRPGLLLFLDEIDMLFDQPEYPEFAAVLRSVAEDPHSRGRFAILVAGLEPTLNRVDRMDGGRNPFYAFFGEIPLWLLKPEDTRTMVVSIGGQMGISYEDDALDLLVEAGGGHPFLTRQLCSQAVRDLERPGTVDRAWAARAVEDYLRLASNYFAKSLWGIDSGGLPLAEAALLRSLAAVQPQPEESLIPLNLPPEERRACQLALDHLRDQSLIRRVENGWELTIPLYRRWVRRYILNLPDEAAQEGAR